MDSITLSQLTNYVQESIRINFSSPVWIRAEISELRENQNGHCYLEFVEKDENFENIRAKVKAVIWSSTYRMLKPYFENSSGQSLRAGIKVLVAVTVEFSGLYGFNLNVRDIDPIFTIGELAEKRLQIIRQLEKDGIADMNKALDFPQLPQRLAIISSPTAAGYEDFIEQLNSRQNGYVFYTKLFPAIMQGEQSENSIIQALEKIYENIELFDAVVIIRGGGASADLSCFDSYILGLNVAQFPIPIITGIGHQRDNTIVDFVANKSLKTPTAVAEHLIFTMQTLENDLYNVFWEIDKKIKNTILIQSQNLVSIQWKIKQSLYNKLSVKKISIEKQKNRLLTFVRGYVSNEKNKIELLDKAIEVHSPSFLIKHGYTITTLNGKRLTTINQIKKGDTIRTILQDGDFESNVN